MTDDSNPTRPTPHGSPPPPRPKPDRTHVDRDQRIPPKELAEKVERFVREQFPEKRKRPR